MEHDRSLLRLSTRRIARFVSGEGRQTRRALARLSDHLLKDIGYARDSEGEIRPI